MFHSPFLPQRSALCNGAQLRLDLGDLLGLGANTLFAGIEYQYWMNKLGGSTDENAVQALLVWRL